jgi:hypothetical protein
MTTTLFGIPTTDTDALRALIGTPVVHCFWGSATIHDIVLDASTDWPVARVEVIRADGLVYRASPADLTREAGDR